MTDLDDLQQRLGVRFHNPHLLHRALTHRSYRNEYPEAIEDNERLEFLGDAVLDFVASAYLYNRFPEMAEGQLTRLRAALVRTEQLAAFAAELRVGASLMLGKGEEESGGRERASILCATFEAIIGALYLDSGLDPVIVITEPLLASTARRVLRRQSDMDARSQLQEWAQATMGQTPGYRTIREDGPAHARVFTVEVNIGQDSYGVGAGRSKQVAAQSAAENALQNIGLA